MLSLYHAHEYGDFKGTIQGLLAAYNYEFSILQVSLPPKADRHLFETLMILQLTTTCQT